MGRVLNKDKDNKKKLKLIVKHIAQVLLYLNYVSLLKKGEPNVVTHILNNYHDDPNKAKTKASCQKNFHTYHINVLITFTLRTHPGTIHLYCSLVLVAKSLLSGELPANLH
ncbi:conserved serine-proline rich protein [Aspergillus lentulus]|nr:conserved serine-proline rich protein [Aspergillus lentulus]